MQESIQIYEYNKSDPQIYKRDKPTNYYKSCLVNY